MPPTIIKEDGSGLADANSYATIADADWYHEGHLYASAWTAASADQKAAALLMATRLLDAEYQFNGTRTQTQQALQWPRRDCREPDGTTAEFLVPDGTPTPHYVVPGPDGQLIVVTGSGLVPADLVPKAVVEATCELARELLILDRTAPPPGEGLKYYNNAGVQTGYDKSDTRPVMPGVVQVLLAKYGALISAKSGAVRLVRV